LSAECHGRAIAGSDDGADDTSRCEKTFGVPSRSSPEAVGAKAGHVVVHGFAW